MRGASPNVPNVHSFSPLLSNSTSYLMASSIFEAYKAIGIGVKFYFLDIILTIIRADNFHLGVQVTLKYAIQNSVPNCHPGHGVTRIHLKA